MPPTPRTLAAGPCTGAVVASVLVALVLLVACAPSEEDGAASPTRTDALPTDAEAPAADGGISPADNDLQVRVDPGDGAPAEEWTLTCVGFVEGSHPDAEAACAHLKELDEPFAPVPDDAVCTEQYGGPQTAHVTGRWGGEPVDVELSRTDGCRISQWDALGPLLPVAVG